MPITLAGPGLRDSLRIAGSPYATWRDIVLTNREVLSAALDLFARPLDDIRERLGSRELEADFDSANELYKLLRGAVELDPATSLCRGFFLHVCRAERALLLRDFDQRRVELHKRFIDRGVLFMARIAVHLLGEHLGRLVRLERKERPVADGGESRRCLSTCTSRPINSVVW